MLGSHRIGFLVIGLSVICNGVTFHLQKAALGDVEPAMLIVIQNSFAAGYFLIAAYIWRAFGWQAGDLHKTDPVAMVRWFKDGWKIIVLAMVLGGGSGWLLQLTTKNYGPEISSFLANLKLVFLVAGGLLLGERATKAELLTAGAIIVGAFLFSWQGGKFQLGALGLMSICCLAVAGKQLIVRSAADKANLPTVMCAMLIGMGVANGFIAVVNNEISWPPGWVFGLLALAGLLNGALGMALLYTSYSLIGVSRAAPIDALRPMVVLLVGILVLGKDLPPPLQIGGAVLVLGGSMLLAKLHKPAPVADDKEELATDGQG